MNYGQLKAAVQQRLLQRTDLSATVIPGFVQDRILYYQKALYAPSEQLDYSVSLITGQSIYPLPVGTQTVLGARFLLGGTIWIPMVRAPWLKDVLAADVLNPPFESVPTYYCPMGQTLRIYPTPVTVYPLELYINASPPAPVLDTDENWWTREAQTLIIEATCADICRLYLNDDEQAMRHDLATAREHAALAGYTMNLKGPGLIRGYM